MADTALRDLERAALTDPSPATLTALRYARIRAGVEPMPEAAPAYDVLDPLHLEGLRKTVDRLNKVASKRGSLPLALLEAPEPHWVTRERPDGTTARIRLRRVTILGDVPDTGAWRYVARLDHKATPLGEVAMIFRTQHANLVSEDRLALYRGRGPACDHCNVRRKRDDTFVVHNSETGATSQVGRSCLALYLGADPLASLHAFDALATLTTEAQNAGTLEDSARADWGVPLGRFLTALLSQSRPGASPRAAWTVAMNRPVADHDTGADRAATILLEARRVMIPALRTERERAQAAALDSVTPLPPWPATVERLSERWHNVSVIVAEDTVAEGQAERAATLVAWYDARQARAERSALADPARACETLRAALRAAGIGVQDYNGGNVTVDAFALARALTLTGPAGTTLRDVAVSLLTAQRAAEGTEDTDTPPMGDFLGARGAEVYVTGTVTRCRPYRSGAGHVIVFRVTGPDGRARNGLVFHSGPRPAGVEEGATVRVHGTVDDNGRDGYDGSIRSVLKSARFTIL